MKKMVCLFFSIIFLSNAQANVGDDLKLAIDEYQYSITVEWDQRDSLQKKSIEEKFLAKLVSLKNQGMNHEDVIRFLISRNPSGSDTLSLKQVLGLTTFSSLSDGEAFTIYNDIIKNSFTGASWEGSNTGEVFLYVTIGVAFLSVLAFSVKPQR